MSSLKRIVPIALAFTLLTLSGGAIHGDGGMHGGGGLLPKVKEFNKMSSEQALVDSRYFRRVQPIFIPILNNMVMPTQLCVSRGRIVVTEPQNYCAQWAVKLSQPENGQDYAVTPYYRQAHAVAESERGVHEAFCNQKLSGNPTMPISDSVSDCLTWSVSVEKDPFVPIPKTFSTLEKAQTFQYLESKYNASNPKCMQWGMRTLTIPTTYTVDFVDGVQNESLGTHQYQLPNCK